MSMLQSPWERQSADEPASRLFWVVPLAVLLVALFILGIGTWLSSGHSIKHPKPVDARIYELPPVHASMFTPSKKTGKSAVHVHKPAKPQHSVKPQHHTAPSSKPQHLKHTKPQKSVARTPSVPSEPIGKQVPHRSKTVKPQRKHHAKSQRHITKRQKLNWANLNQQINKAVASSISRSDFPQVHDPHTMVARFYLASVLRKLQRVGDMNYTGSMVGNARVMVIIGRDGQLVGFKLLASSGNEQLDQVANNIVHMSAPFAPFPSKLRKRTSRLKLVINMQFEGYRDVNPE